MGTAWWVLGATLTLLAPHLAAAQGDLAIVSVSPARHSLDAGLGAPIVVDFDRPVLRSSVTAESFWAFARWSGTVAGTFAFSDGDRRVTLKPARRFSAGETVMVILSHDLQGADGSFLRAAGYSFQFWTRSRRARLDFSEIDRFSTRSTPEVSTRAYGGFGSDLDGDGFLDLTIVNEDTDDLRTFLNLGDRTGRLRETFLPPSRVGNVPSPSEPSDFDRDGNVDVVVANTRDNTLSILLGNGDGTFSQPQHVTVGNEPRGVAVLDADGDGDVDVAATTFVAGRVALLFNDGDGRFGGRRAFGTGGGERGIAAGDMNDDGILDLVVGTLSTQEVQVYTGDGNGGFTLTGRQDSGGETWMVALGDVDGNATEDVVVVNSRTDNGAILAGDGTGQLGPPRLRTTDPFPLATDLADLDGDGDLDWVTSSFAGDWMLFENDGLGDFSLSRRFAPAQAASCSIPMDLDNDGSLDLVLIDEIADEVILMTRGASASAFASDFESEDTADWSLTRGSVAVVAPGLRGSGHALEVTVDGTARRSFVESRHPDGEASWSVRFDLDVNQVDLRGQIPEILRFSGVLPRRAMIHLSSADGQYRVHWIVKEAGGFREVGSTRVPAKGLVRLEVEWASASSAGVADGQAVLVKNDRVQTVAADVDNYGQVIHFVRIGLPGGSVDAGGGIFLLDNYASNR